MMPRLRAGTVCMAVHAWGLMAPSGKTPLHREANDEIVM